MAATLDKILEDIHRIKAEARRNGVKKRPLWPMIILRSPKGWTCPKEIDGKRTEDYWRSHQVPMGEMHEKPGAREDPRKMDEELQAGGTVRQDRAVETRTRGIAAEGQPSHERQSTRQRRPVCSEICDCRTSVTTPSR